MFQNLALGTDQLIEEIPFPPISLWTKDPVIPSPRIAILDIGSGHVSGRLFQTQNDVVDVIDLGHFGYDLGYGVTLQSPELKAGNVFTAELYIRQIAEVAKNHDPDAFVVFGTYALRTALEINSGKNAIWQFENAIYEVTGRHVPVVILGGPTETHIIHEGIKRELIDIRGLEFGPNTFFSSIGRGSLHGGVFNGVPEDYFDEPSGVGSLITRGQLSYANVFSIVRQELENTAWRKNRQNCSDIIFTGGDWVKLARTMLWRNRIPEDCPHPYICTSWREIEDFSRRLLPMKEESLATKMAIAALRTVGEFVFENRLDSRMHFIGTDPKMAVAMMVGFNSNFNHHRLT